jgi:hypothetical protein
MPVDYACHRNGTYVRLTSHGVITDDELLSAVHLMYASDEDTKHHRCALLDFSLVEQAEVSSDAVREIARLNLAASKLVAPGAPVALVAPLDHMYGLGRMWEVFVEGTGWQTQVFKDLEEAKDWLEERLVAQRRSVDGAEGTNE